MTSHRGGDLVHITSVLMDMEIVNTYIITPAGTCYYESLVACAHLVPEKILAYQDIRAIC